jgi:hypothetical protein
MIRLPGPLSDRETPLFPLLRQFKGGWFYYRMRTFLLPLFVRKSIETPVLRQDLDSFLPLFEEAYENFLSVLQAPIDEINWPLGKIYNGFFQSVDAELYYCFIRTFKPSCIIEVGSGHSSWMALDAIRRNRSGRLVSIDPHPRTRIPKQYRRLQERVENVPSHMFQHLRQNDILFIDSSHTSTEAKYHTTHIFPLLRPGVLIHYHDVYYPYDLFFRSDKNLFGESEILLRFLRENQESYHVITGSSFVTYARPQSVKAIVKSLGYDPQFRPSSLWIEKTN